MPMATSKLIVLIVYLKNMALHYVYVRGLGGRVGHNISSPYYFTYIGYNE